MPPLASAKTQARRRRARRLRRSARRPAEQPPHARRRRRATTMSPLASRPRGARRTRSRRPGATAPTARRSARRPAVFASSPALHHLRHYTHTRSTHTRSRAVVAEDAAAVMHSLAHTNHPPQGLIHDLVASVLYI
eukprot:scaffold67843_cov45-Phaeocystis_antarctica.AAC.1